MEESKYITFTKEDIIVALEEFYFKNKGKKIDIGFDKNQGGLSSVAHITIKISLYEDTAEVQDFTPRVGILHNNEISKESVLIGGSLLSTITYNK